MPSEARPSELPALAFGDIILVPFPFTNQTTSKQRPAVVISADSYNTAKPDIILMAITSQLRPATMMGDTWITDWQAAGLLKPSAIKPVIATLEQSLIIKPLGTLTATDAAALRQTLGEIIG
jgi:mRNA interferase MazF